MKNLLTHISPSKEFYNGEHKAMAKIQIDNSFSLGWRKEDILLMTNFDYEHNGVKAIVVGDENYCQSHPPATKIYAIVRLFEEGLVKAEELYWYHDFDCFQLAPFTGADPELGTADVGLTNYGRMPRFCSASIFFKVSAIDIFKQWKGEIQFGRTNEERAIIRMVQSGVLGDRFNLLNITYAFHRFNLRSCYQIADKPIRAAHFHLTPDKYAFYVEGENKIGMRLIPDRLVDIFHDHGWSKETIW